MTFFFRSCTGTLIAGSCLALADRPLAADTGGAPAAMAGARISAYAEYWWPDDELERDIDLFALTAEFEFRFRRPLLQPLSIGAMASLVRADGTVVLDGGIPDLTLDSDASGASLGLFARIHGFEYGRTSTWFDLSGGVLWTDTDFPAGGSRFNGIFRSGLGFAHEVNGRSSVIGGLRYGHVSNGSGINADNPAYDAMSVYLGLRFSLEREPTPSPDARPAVERGSLSRGTTEWEYFASVRDEHSEIALLAMTAAVEYRLPGADWMGVTVSGSFYYVAGHDEVPDIGMGMFNAGSVGQSLNLGLRVYPWRSDGWSWFVEGQAGAVVAGHFTRAWPFAPEGEESRFVDPCTWSLAARYGTGVEIHVAVDLSLQVGYRHLHLDNYDYATTPDYEGHGGFVALGRRF